MGCHQVHATPKEDNTPDLESGFVKLACEREANDGTAQKVMLNAGRRMTRTRETGFVGVALARMRSRNSGPFPNIAVCYCIRGMTADAHRHTIHLPSHA